MNNCILSILIPAYNYPEGVIRILDSFKFSDKTSDYYEVIISDDSTDLGVYNAIKKYIDLGLCQYRIGVRNGAVDNWNSYRALNGTYIWIIHHDEFPTSEINLVNLTQYLLKGNSDVYLFDVIKYSSGSLNKHCPTGLKKNILLYCPELLFYCNVVGPMSTIIFKRNKFNGFDSNLIWLVDVDFYYSIVKSNSILISGYFSVTSEVGRSESITNKIDKSLYSIASRERKYLLQKFQMGNRLLYNALNLIISFVIRVFLRLYRYVQ